MKEKNSSGLYVLRLGLILFVITAVVALLLGGVNAVTKDVIAEHTAEKIADSISLVLPSNEKPEEITEFEDASGLVTALYRIGTDGYAVELVVGGSQGDIDMMVGVGADQTVTGISFISMSETSGLGAVANAQSAKGEAFRSQFIGTSGEVRVTKDGGKIDSLTGATITSRAVAKGVTAALACVADNS